MRINTPGFFDAENNAKKLNNYDFKTIN